jgi:hypothetical protein
MAIVAVTVAVAFFLNPAQRRNPLLTDPPEVFAHKAKEILDQLGYSSVPTDSAYGFELYDDYVKYRRQNTDASTFKSDLARDRPGWIRFWYRQSPDILTPQSMNTIGPIYARLGTRVSQDDPPNDLPDMAKIVMDSQGRLLEFSAFPRMEGGPSKEADWSVLFRAAGVDQSALTSVEPAGVPTTVSDMQRAWTGAWPGQPDEPLRVEAAAWRGRAVFFQVIGSWGLRTQQPKQETIERLALTAISISVVLFSLLGGSYLAWRNVRLGRSDRQGAFRLALFAFCILMLSWLTGSDFKLDPSGFNVGLNAMAECVGWSVVVGTMYLAIEPFVRKRWPHALISWNRVLEGRLRDPLVGRDLLVGVLFAAGLSIVRTSTLLLEVMSPMLPEADVLNAMRGNAHALSFVLALIFDSANIPLALFFLFCFFRIVFRNPWIASVAFFFLINAFVNLPSQSFSPNPEASGVLIGTLFCSLWLLAVTRFGLVGGMSMWFADRIFRAEIMVNPSGWHAERMYLLLGAVGVLAVYAFVISVGNRPILSTKLLDQHT